MTPDRTEPSPAFDDEPGDLLTSPRPRIAAGAAGPASTEGRPVSKPATAAPPAPMALPWAPFLLMVVVLVIVGVLGVLVLNTKINENSFVLDGLRRRSVLDLREQQLNRDLEEAQSPGNLGGGQAPRPGAGRDAGVHHVARRQDPRCANPGHRVGHHDRGPVAVPSREPRPSGGPDRDEELAGREPDPSIVLDAPGEAPQPDRAGLAATTLGPHGR